MLATNLEHRPRHTWGAQVLGCAVFVLSSIVSTLAIADDATLPPLEAWIIVASEKEGGIDPKLANFSALKKPPFNAYKSFTLEEVARLELVKDKESEHVVQDGAVLRVKPLESGVDGRHRLRISISDKAQKSYMLKRMEVACSKGEPFFIAGPKAKTKSAEGTLVLGLLLKK